MAEPCILISGPAVSADEVLAEELRQSAEVLRNADNSRIQSILSSRTIDLMIIEVTSTGREDVEQVQLARNRFPGLPIILVDDSEDREVTVAAFACGVKDAFRKPYKRYLLAERVNALLRRPARSGGPKDRKTGDRRAPGKGLLV